VTTRLFRDFKHQRSTSELRVYIVCLTMLGLVPTDKLHRGLFNHHRHGGVARCGPRDPRLEIGTHPSRTAAAITILTRDAVNAAVNDVNRVVVLVIFAAV